MGLAAAAAEKTSSPNRHLLCHMNRSHEQTAISVEALLQTTGSD